MKKHDESRRTFFKISALGAGMITLGAANVVAAEQKPSSGFDKSNDNLPWKKKSMQIADNQIKNKVDADIVIIGAGLAGMCAAISAKEAGANPIIIDKNRTFASRGMHITAFDSNTQKKLKIDLNYRQVIRELVRWAQGRVDEELVHLFSRKSGACFDWLDNLVTPKGLEAGIWSDYYKGPDYTEYAVAHIFKNPKTKEVGNGILLKALEEIAKEKGIEIRYKTKAVQLIKEGDKVTGVIAGEPDDYTQFNAKNGVILATGDYASNKEMAAYYCPISAKADAQIYFPNKCNTGDGHIMALDVGGAMQKVQEHAAVIHLEAGAMSYGFLHINALGKRFKNEDVNTQSKSCGKLYQPGGTAWTIYDSKGLTQVQEQMDKGVAGGLFFGQMEKVIGEKWSLEEEKELLEKHIEEEKVVTAKTLEELATKMNVPVKEFIDTVAQYNKIVKNKNDTDLGKRSELLTPIDAPPYYGGKLLATVLTMSGGLHTDSSLLVLDKEDKPIKNLYVIGSAQGDFFAADYPTICPGIGHGRCVTFGRLVGLLAAGKSVDEVKSIVI